MKNIYEYCYVVHEIYISHTLFNTDNKFTQIFLRHLFLMINDIKICMRTTYNEIMYHLRLR